MYHYDVESIFKRMRYASDAENDSQLAKFLNVKSSAIVAWKTAKHPPYRACFEIFQETGFTVEWLITGDQPIQSPVVGGAKDEKSINMSLDRFLETFEVAILNGLRMQMFQATEGSTVEDIRRLGTLYYHTVNKDIQLPNTTSNTPLTKDLPVNELEHDK